MDKKLIVFIDDNIELRGIIKDVLESKDFRVETFPSFDEALKFLENNKPELIISDLIGHDDYNGVEFYIRHIMEKRIQFALWTGSLDFTDKKGIQNFSLFLDGMPQDFRITYDPDKALQQGEVDLIVEDFKNNRKHIFPCFAKPGSIDKILKYFNLGQFVILYFCLH